MWVSMRRAALRTADGGVEVEGDVTGLMDAWQWMLGGYDIWMNTGLC
jgi:hypothetical protein